MGRFYTVEFENVSVSAVEDLICVYAGANMAFAVHEITLGQTSSTSVQATRFSLKHLPATVTAGSGGTAPTPQPLDPKDAAATVTARANDTTQATTSGTATTRFADVFYAVPGYQQRFSPPQICEPSAAISWSLDSAPGGAQAMTATMLIEELF